MTAARQINIVINAIDRSEAILSRAERNISNLTKTAALAAAAYAGLQIGKSAIQSVTDYAEQVRKLSIETGLTTEQTSGMIFAAKQMGLSFSELAGPIGQLERRLFGIVDAQNKVSTGAKSGIQNLDLYGIKTVDTKGKLLTFAQVLANIGDKLKSLPEGPEKTGLVEAIASRAGASGSSLGSLISFLSLGTDGFNKFAAQAAKAGIILGKDDVASALIFKQTMSQADAVIRGVEITIVSNLLPSLTKLGLWFIGHQEDIQKFAKAFIDNLVKMANEADHDVNSIIKLFQWFPDNQSRVAAAILLIAVAFSGIGGVGLVGLLAIIAALKWIPDNRARLVAEIIAIGVAFTVAFGPESAAAAALLFIIDRLSQINDLAERSQNLIEHGQALSNEQYLQKQSNDLSTQIKTIEATPPSGLKPGANSFLNSIIRSAEQIGGVAGPGNGMNGSGTDAFLSAQQRASQINKLQSQKDSLDRQIADIDTSKLINADKNRKPSPDIGSPNLPDAGAGQTFPFPDAGTKEKVDEFAKMLEDALEDGIVTLKEFINLNQQARKQGVDELTVSEVALMEARKKITDGDFAEQEQAYNLAKAIVELNYAAGMGSKTFATFEKDVTDTMNSLLDDARSAIFTRPTREQADLSLNSARVDEQIAKFNLALKPVTDARDAYIASLNKEKDSLNAAKDAADSQLDAAKDQATAILDTFKTVLDDQKAPENTNHLVPRAFTAISKAWEDQHNAAEKNLENAQKNMTASYDLQKKMVDAQFKAQLDKNDLDTNNLQNANKNALVQWTSLQQSVQLEQAVLDAHDKVQQALLDASRQDLTTEGQRQQMVDDLAKRTTDITTDFANVHATIGDTLVPAYDRNVKAIDGYTQAITDAAAKINDTVAGINGAAGSADTSNVNALRTV